MDYRKIINLLRYIFLAGSHIILIFTFAYLAGIMLFQLDLNAAIIILTSAVSYFLYWKFYLKTKKIRKNIFFSYLSVLLFVIFGGYLLKIHSLAEIFDVLNGIFNMFIAVLIGFTIAAGAKVLLIISILMILNAFMSAYPLKKYIHYIALAVISGIILYFIPTGREISPETYQNIIYLFQRSVFLIYGGFIWFNIHYLLSEDDYSIDQKPK